MYEILSNIIYAWVLPYVEGELGEYQCGFPSAESTNDQIFSLRQILEKMYEHKIETHNVFVDFKATYDNVIQARLFQAMEEPKIPPKLTRLVQLTMKNMISEVQIQRTLSKPPEIRNG
jgi:hypothetical protein